MRKAWQQGLNWLLGPPLVLSSQKVQDEQQALGSCFLTSASPIWHIFCADCFGDIAEEHPDLSVLKPNFSGAPPCSSARMHTQLLQSCLTLCDPPDCGLPGSSVHGFLQARILEWVAVPSSRGSSRPRDRTCVSCIADGFPTAEPLGNPPCSRGCLSVPSWSLDGPGCLLLISATPGWLEHTFKIQVKGGQEPWLVAEPASSSPRNLCGHLLPPGLLTTPPDSQHSPTPRHIVTLPASLQTWAWLSQPRRWGSPLPSQRWSGCSG